MARQNQRLERQSPGPLGPYRGAVAISIGAADHALDEECLALVVGVAGDVKVDFIADGGSGVTLKLPAGIHELAVTKVYKVGTTATSIVALY